eukprot:g770.t1
MGGAENARIGMLTEMMRDNLDIIARRVQRNALDDSKKTNITDTYRKFVRSIYDLPFYVQADGKGSEDDDLASEKSTIVDSMSVGPQKAVSQSRYRSKEARAILLSTPGESEGSHYESMKLDQFLESYVLDLLCSRRFTDNIGSRMKKTRDKLMRRDPRVVSKAIRCVMKLYKESCDTDYFACDVKTRSNMDAVAAQKLRSIMGPSVERYVKLLLTLLRSLDVHLIAIGDDVEKDDAQLWHIARRMFATKPYSNGHDARYSRVKRYLREKFGATAINEGNKPRLKAIARNRGVEKRGFEKDI